MSNYNSPNKQMMTPTIGPSLATKKYKTRDQAMRNNLRTASRKAQGKRYY